MLDAVAAAIADLEEREREVFLRVDVRGELLGDVARERGEPEAVTRARLCEARERFIAALFRRLRG